MFTKVFRSIYDGTLADNWKALVTFQQFLILADEQGVVDMTPAAMSRTTGIPLDVLLDGIAHLESPDPMSRTPDMEGRRIARLDAHRPWGWFLVNFKKYNELRSREEKREADRIRIAGKRANARHEATESDMSQDVAECRDESQGVANVAYTDTDTDVKQKHVASATRFDEFWQAYPSRVGRKPSVKLWASKRLDALADMIIADVNARKVKDRKWREGFIPNPRTYLSEERWNDGTQQAAPASQLSDFELRMLGAV